MSKIAIVVVSAPDLVRVIEALRRAVPGLGMQECRRRIASGDPVVEFVLFENDYPEVAARLEGLLRSLPATGAVLRMFELRAEEVFDAKAADLVRWEISPDTLSNILASAADYA